MGSSGSGFNQGTVVLENIFKKVHLSDKKKILKQLVEDRVVWLVKTESTDVRQVVPAQMVEDKIAECDFIHGQEFDLKNAEMGIVSISYGEDCYFFYALVTLNRAKVFIDTQGDLFYLQRRKSVRIEMPSNYPAQCKILDYNGQELPVDAIILDISSGGCKLSLSSSEPIIKDLSRLKLRITLSHRSPIFIGGVVRYAKPIRDASDLPQIMGIEFVDCEPLFEGKMLNMIMDLQREIFLKYNNKK